MIREAVPFSLPTLKQIKSQSQAEKQKEKKSSHLSLVGDIDRQP